MKKYSVLLLVAAIGFLNASYLSMVHLSGSKTCGMGDWCSEALTSDWAAVGGIPVAALGAGMFLALIFFTARILVNRESVPVIEPWLFIISSAGVVASAFFAVVQGAVIHHWCPLCLFSAGLTTTFFLICISGCLKSGSIVDALKKPGLLNRGLPWAMLAIVLPPLVVLTAEVGTRDAGGRERAFR